MSITNDPTLREELRRYNDRLDESLRSHYGMTFRSFKIVKALTQLAGVGAAVYAMMLGAEPMAALTLATIMVSGPEALEILIEGQEG